ncbi:MAG: peroxiredoxin-like family protein [Bryobacteraceae bacterium]
MREHENEFKQVAASLVAVGLGDLDYARLFRDESRIAFPLLVDSEKKAYQTAQLKSGNLFHIFRRDNSVARARVKAAGFKQHRLGKDPFQLGASFVFAPGDRDLLIHLNRTFSDNADTKDLLAALR